MMHTKYSPLQQNSNSSGLVEQNIVSSFTDWCNELLLSLYSVFFATSVKFERTDTIVYYNSTSQNVGEGAFSVVLKASKAFSSGPQYALKRMIVQSNELEKMIEVEINALNKFKHHNIIQLIDQTRVSENGSSVVYLMFPYMRRGSLRDHLNGISTGIVQRTSSELRTVLEHYISICSAINTLHMYQPSYVHQDIKPEVGDMQVLYGT
jgi:hypothetical protein